MGYNLKKDCVTNASTCQHNIVLYNKNDRLFNPADGRSFQHDCISAGRLIELRNKKLNTHTLIQNETQNYINKTNQKKNLIEKRIKGLLLCIISEKKEKK